MDEKPEPDERASSAPPPVWKRAASARFEAARALGTFGTVGLSFVFALVIGAAFGLWLDRVTGWSPICFIFFFLCGLAAGILNLYRAVRRFSK